MKQLVLTLIILTGFISHSFAQTVDNPDYSTHPYWINMMLDQDVNFYDVQEAFHTYYADKDMSQEKGWKQYYRWEWYQSRHIYEDGTRHEADKVLKEYMQYIENHPEMKDEGDWENLGPFNLPSKGYIGLGRINALAFHPTDPNTVFIGAPAGGIWKTTNSGSSWEALIDHLPTLGVSSIVVDWNNPDHILIGTGDRDAGDAAGMGVFKSEDGGETWTLSNTGMGNATVGRMIQDPVNPDIIYAASSGGIFKSTDGGNNWVQKQNGSFKEIVFKTTDSNILYAVTGGNLYTSRNAGEYWEQITNGLPGAARGVIGVSEDEPNTVYFFLTTSSEYLGLYKSNDEGESWVLQSNSPNIMSWGCNGGSGGQAWYDLDIAVDPANADVIYAGGVNCFKSTDGGVNWEIVSHWSGDCGVQAVHADLHILEWNPANGYLYVGNDGGIYRTGNDGSSWSELTNGLAITQVYRIAQSRTYKEKILFGSQDNGSSTYYDGNWYFSLGGDGMDCLVDHMDENYSYAEYQNGNGFRLFNNNTQIQIFGEGVFGIDETGAWITPYVLAEHNTNIMFVGMNNLWRTDRIKYSTMWWDKITDIGGGKIEQIDHSPKDENLLYFSKGGTLYKSENVLDEFPAWDVVSVPGSGTIYDIETDLDIADGVYITRGTGIYYSEDRGETWMALNGSLPNINKNSVEQYPNSPNGIYIGTDAGVYYMDDSMDDWIMFSEGLPVDASVNEVEVFHNPENAEEDVVRAGTYGRGVWSSTVWRGVPMADFIAENTTVALGCFTNFHDQSTGVPTSWSWTFEGGSPASSDERNPSDIYYTAAGTYEVSLTVSNENGSDTKTLTAYITVDDNLVPEVDFMADQEVICTGGQVYFTEITTNCAETWLWEFSPSTVTFKEGTNQNSPEPVVQFNESAMYSVTLTVENEVGPNSLTKEDYINVSVGESLTFTEDFESGDFSTRGWIIENPDQDITWEIAEVGGNEPGTKAAFINLHDYQVQAGPRDRMISPLLDFPDNDASYRLSFDHAYATQYVSYSDSLIIFMSADCGETWHQVAGFVEEGDGNFATHENLSADFIPETADDWCGSGWGADCITINLPYIDGQENGVNLAFETYFNYGNNLYIDNVVVEQLVGLSPGEYPDEILIYPNPTDGKMTIEFPSRESRYHIEIMNASGQLLMNRDLENIAKLDIDLKPYGQGLYLIKVTNRDNGLIINDKILVK